MQYRNRYSLTKKEIHNSRTQIFQFPSKYIADQAHQTKTKTHTCTITQMYVSFKREREDQVIEGPEVDEIVGGVGPDDELIGRLQ
jgi:hypothetical protein